MANTMQFDLVSPERKLASMAVTLAEIPGAEGDFSAMPDHAPLVSTLRPGILKAVDAAGQESAYVVTGGFAEVGAEGVSVLAESCIPLSDMTAEMMNSLIADIEAECAVVSDEMADEAARKLATLRDVASNLNL